MGEVALKIREIGAENAVPMVEAAPLARQLAIVLEVEARQPDGLVADEALALARALQDVPAEIQAELANLSFQDRTFDAEPVYQRLLALPGADSLEIKLHRAKRAQSPPPDPTERESRWLEVAGLAESSQRPEISREAWDRLAMFAYRQGNFALTAERFRAADLTGVAPRRDARTWLIYAEVMRPSDHRAESQAVIEREIARSEASANPAYLGDLFDALSTLQAQAGEEVLAYRSLRRAHELRQRGDAVQQFVPLATIKEATTTTDTEIAQLNAALDNARREAELELAHAQRNLLLGSVGATSLVLVLLTVAYRLKRRAAAAEALAREAAELRAENAHLLALRYQLNPHFLFNALEGLRSRFSETPAAGLTLLDRLTEFCRLVFVPHPSGLHTVGEECAMLEAFLRIEQDRWEDNLELQLDFDPHASELLLPTMLIQPLVENALKYGAQTSAERIRIEVTTRRNATDELTITISNSGHWVDETSVVPGKRSSHLVGLSNIRQRLCRFYPDRHRFEIGPSPAGVTAQLILSGLPVLPA